MPYIYQDAEARIKDRFYQDSFDGSSTLDVTALMSEKLIADNKAKDPEYYQHREGVVHVTSLTKCLRGVVYEMLGAEKTSEQDARKLGVFQAGNLFEEYVIDSLGDRVIERQREYNYTYKNIKLVGRSDYVINDNGTLRIGENKSVHTDSFWHRKKSGELVAWQNQVQLQVYMWLERELYGNNYDGILTYISKDDCVVSSCALKYNPDIIENIVKPALEILNDAYTAKDPAIAAVPPLVTYSESRGQYQKNFLCTYCEYHEHCAGKGWVLEATNEVTRKNRELKDSMPSAHTVKKVKPTIGVAQVEATPLPPVTNE